MLGAMPRHQSCALNGTNSRSKAQNSEADAPKWFGHAWCPSGRALLRAIVWCSICQNETWVFSPCGGLIHAECKYCIWQLGHCYIRPGTWNLQQEAVSRLGCSAGRLWCCFLCLPPGVDLAIHLKATHSMTRAGF